MSLPSPQKASGVKEMWCKRKKKKNCSSWTWHSPTGEPAASQLIKTPPGFLLSVCLSPASMCSAHLRASHHFTARCSGVPRNLSAWGRRGKMFLFSWGTSAFETSRYQLHILNGLWDDSRGETRPRRIQRLQRFESDELKVPFTLPRLQSSQSSALAEEPARLVGGRQPWGQKSS